MMPVCEQRLLDRDVFGRKDGLQRCEPGGFRVAGVDEEAGGAGADDVGVCTLERELWVNVSERHVRGREISCTLLGLPPKMRITRGLSFSMGGRSASGSTIVEYLCFCRRVREEVKARNRHGRRMFAWWLTRGRSESPPCSAAEASCLIDKDHVCLSIRRTVG